MEVCIFHSVNSGLYFWDGKSGLLVDGIHGGRECGMSSLPELMSRQLEHHTGFFAHTSGVLFTHLHSDHFQRQGLLQLLNTPEPPCVYGPGLLESNVTVHPICNGLGHIFIDNFSVLAKETAHDGRQFSGEQHQSYVIRTGKEVFLIAGDALFASQDMELADMLCGVVKAAFCNLYHLRVPQNQSFLLRLRPEQIFLVHLPFLEDDRFQYWEAVRQLERYLSPKFPPVTILPHMSWIDGKAAQWATGQKGKTMMI